MIFRLVNKSNGRSSLYFDIIKNDGENMFCGSYFIYNIIQAGTTTIFNVCGMTGYSINGQMVS